MTEQERAELTELRIAFNDAVADDPADKAAVMMQRLIELERLDAIEREAADDRCA